MYTNDCVPEIESLALTSGESRTPWYFFRAANVSVKQEKTCIEFGAILYKIDNKAMESPAIRIHSWVFMFNTAVNKIYQIGEPSDSLLISAFREQKCYTFLKVEHATDKPRVLIQYVVKTFWKWMYPGVAVPSEDEFKKMQFPLCEVVSEITQHHIAEAKSAGFDIPM